MVDNASEEIPAAPAVRRPWVRSLLLGVVILLCGAAIGSTITAVVLERRPMRDFRRSDHLPERIAREMQNKYGLTDEQERQLLAVFTEHEKKLSDIRAEVQPRMEAEHEALRRAVEAVLTPEQAAEWRKEFEQMRRPWHRQGGGRPWHRQGGEPPDSGDRP